MAKKESKYKTDMPLLAVRFRCPHCWYKFEEEPGRIVDAPDKPHHPWDYFAECPKCGEDAHQQAWERNIMASFGKGTGPRTPEGIASVTRNLEGHPTPEEALRTRFNAVKHGLTAQVATYFPAKPGKYPHCGNCDVDWGVCAEQVACLKRTELFMQHHIAFETRDPSLLTGLRAMLHSNIQAIIDDMVLAIINTGVEIRAPQWYTDKEGVLQFVEYTNTRGERKLIEEISAHPLLKVLTDFLAKNNMALADMNMTPKVQEDEAILKGHLDATKSSGSAVEAYAKQSAESMARLQALIEASHGKREPVLINQQTENE